MSMVVRILMIVGIIVLIPLFLRVRKRLDYEDPDRIVVDSWTGNQTTIREDWEKRHMRPLKLVGLAFLIPVGLIVCLSMGTVIALVPTFDSRLAVLLFLGVVFVVYGTALTVFGFKPRRKTVTCFVIPLLAVTIGICLIVSIALVFAGYGNTDLGQFMITVVFVVAFLGMLLVFVLYKLLPPWELNA